MPSVYVETTIPSLATRRPSRDIIIAGRQAATILFWESERHKYDLYVSQYVIDECSFGDAEAAKRRLDFIKDLYVIPNHERVSALAITYQRLLSIPDKSKVDSFHLAICVVAGMDYLLSWNCTHLGVHTLIKMQKYNDKHGLHTPLLITPEALMEPTREV